MSAWPNIHDATAAAALAAAPIDAVERCMLALVDTHGGPVAARMAHEHLASGGKRLRARLALAAVQALGGEGESCVPWAAACELLHNASLIHDDWQDGDKVRRGRPALWTVYGAPQAINAGDLLLMLPTLAVGDLDVADALKWRLSSCVARHAARTAAGQAQELDLRSMRRLSLEDYLDAARGKTAGLFGMPVEGAALLTGHADEDARRLARPFETLGLAFQLVDDVIDLYGDKGRGRRGADIREGKVSALVVTHLSRHPEERLWLAGILRMPREQLDDELVASVSARFVEGGALEAVLERVHSLLDELDGPDLVAEPGLRAVGVALRQRIAAPLERLDV